MSVVRTALPATRALKVSPMLQVTDHPTGARTDGRQHDRRRNRPAELARIRQENPALRTRSDRKRALFSSILIT